MLILTAGFILFPLTLLSIFLPLKKSLSVSIIISLFMLFFFIKEKASPSAISLCLATLNLTPIFCKELTNLFHKRKALINQKMEESRKYYSHILKKQEMTKQQNLDLEQGLSELINLYEVTQEMNVTRDFPELFEVFNQALRQRVKFGRGYLILVEKKEEMFLKEKCFVLNPSGGAVRRKDEKTEDDRLITMILEMISSDKKEHFLSPGQLNSLWSDVRLKDDLETLAVVPIGLDASSPAVFIGENLSEDDFEKLLILSRQLSMEMQRVSLQEKVQELAITDGLTALFVRRHLIERLREELNRSLRYSLKLSVLMIDIDHFKDYNDRYGHLVGDLILTEVASIMKSSLRDVDLVGRYGGEEFCIVLPETNKDGGLQVAERIRWAIDNHSFKAYDEVTKVTVSIGVSTSPDDGVLMEELIDKADKALYEAKRAGRNRIFSNKK